MSKITRDQSLKAVPIIPALLEEIPVEGGGMRLVVAVPTRPMQRKILRLPPTVKKEFELDAFGLKIVRWCDGKNTVEDLLRLFSKSYKLDPQESEKALFTFLRTLVSKGILVFTIPQKNNAASSAKPISGADKKS
jgi:hypothetical protein